MSLRYIEYHFHVEPVIPGRDILVAELGLLGFESFVEESDGLKAYITEAEWNDSILDNLQLMSNPEFKVSFEKQEIEPVNWNEEWERQFNPIVVNDQCAVRAPFHDPFEVKYEIVIEPKMSFGTGHHETTFMMLQQMLDLDFQDKRVLDMGCGTAVLAILAEMKGARNADAVDIDAWCVENSIENAHRNNCNRIEVWQGDIDSVEPEKPYDIIIVNINRNILLRHIPDYSRLLNDSGILLLSGFYERDLSMIKASCAEHRLQYDNHLTKNDWVAAKFVH